MNDIDEMDIHFYFELMNENEKSEQQGFIDQVF